MVLSSILDTLSTAPVLSTYLHSLYPQYFILGSQKRGNLELTTPCEKFDVRPKPGIRHTA